MNQMNYIAVLRNNIQKDLEDNVCPNGGNITVLELAQKYINLKNSKFEKPCNR